MQARDRFKVHAPPAAAVEEIGQIVTAGAGSPHVHERPDVVAEDPVEEDVLVIRRVRDPRDGAGAEDRFLRHER